MLVARHTLTILTSQFISSSWWNSWLFHL